MDNDAAKSGNSDEDDESRNAMPLPLTLVRIPTEHAPTVQAHAEDSSMLEGGLGAPRVV